jgi:predicted O-linked N-acetylglucosamine transferase (SPINDLY family)
MASAADLFNRAFSSFQQGRLEEAERSFKQLLRKDPKNLPALNVLAIVLISLKRYADAEPYLQAALRLNATSDVTFYNYGLALKAMRRSDEALQRLTQALALNSGNAETWNNRGAVLNDLSDFSAAIQDFDRALALNPRYPAALFNKSRSLAELKRYDEALASCDAALALKPDLAEAWFGRGFIFQQLRRPAEAAQCYSRALQIDPRIPLLKGNLLHQKMLICDWRGIEGLIAEIDRDLGAGQMSAEPFGWLGVSRSRRSLQICAELYNAAKYPAVSHAPGGGHPSGDGKIRIGYVSGEFRQQATSLLLVGVLEHHDRERFEIIAIDNGHGDGSEIRARIEGAVNEVVAIQGQSDPEAAETIRAKQIDILVNLNGYFGDGRTGVFARRPAPVQVNYLGFPGTLGAPYMDYIVADRRVLPEADKAFYAEKVAWLPHCYQANDRDRPISPRAFTRAECGLPADGFVFCCFNNSYKITPDTFDRWMRILTQVEGSVLWLLEDGPEVVANLKREAAARGVDAARLVFAGRLPPAEHLARHRCADLFLDTLPYNAHTTASDALWAGLPILTCPGETFAGRVAASLLDNVHLPELIAPTPDAYERMAIELAGQPDVHAAVVRKVRDGRLTTPLFDTQAFTRDLEAAFAEMHRRHVAGLGRDHIAV